MLAEFTINNKIYLTTKVSPFITNYSRELRMGIDLGRKEKVKKIMEFAKRMRKVQEEAGVVLKKVQKKIKRKKNVSVQAFHNTKAKIVLTKSILPSLLHKVSIHYVFLGQPCRLCLLV